MHHLKMTTFLRFVGDQFSITVMAIEKFGMKTSTFKHNQSNVYDSKPQYSFKIQIQTKHGKKVLILQTMCNLYFQTYCTP